MHFKKCKSKGMRLPSTRLCPRMAFHHPFKAYKERGPDSNIPVVSNWMLGCLYLLNGGSDTKVEEYSLLLKSDLNIISLLCHFFAEIPNHHFFLCLVLLFNNYILFLASGPSANLFLNGWAYWKTLSQIWAFETER